MLVIRRIGCLILTLCFGLTGTSQLFGEDGFDREVLKIKDRIVLKSGQTLAGKYIDEVKEDGRVQLVFRTEDGIALKLDKARFVAKLYTVSQMDDEYNKKVDEMSDSAEDHHRLYNWCEDQKSGRTIFRDQIKYHLERIMELDPNDDVVKRRLKYKHIESEGRWVPQAKYFELHGYQRHGASWRPYKQIVLDEQSEQYRKKEGGLRKSFKTWRNKFSKRKVDFNGLMEELYEFCTEESVRIVRDEAIEERDPNFRKHYIEAIGRVESRDAMLSLIYFAIEDPHADLRDRALTMLQQKQKFDPGQVAASLSGYLVNQNNRQLILRAANAIGELGVENAILPLVKSVVTTHQVAPGDDPGRMNVGFSDQGVSNFGVGGGGGPRMMQFKNSDVLSALQKITGKDFGYDREQWYQWYLENHTHYDLRLRK